MATGDYESRVVVEPQSKPDTISKTDIDIDVDRVPLDETAVTDDPDSDFTNTDPNSTTAQLSQTNTTNGVTVVRNISDRERKIGHRRVGQGGEITYKKIQSSQIMGSIQLGIQQAVGGLASKPERDLLMQDFMTVETTNFPTQGSNQTPAHHYSDFRFKTYAPIAFRYFRDLFGIQPEDFLISMCSYPLRELSNPGASGSIFYLTDDDEFIVKTVQHKEGEFLQKLLPGYYMNLNQNPRTLLPKFFGLYCFQCNHKNVRLVVMNNILPSGVRLHQKYDLKGSTYKRKANKSEKQKKSPTFKDLDFLEHHPEGLYLESETYNALVKTIQRDCRVLQSFKIMDYSLLLGIHNMDCKDKSNKNEMINQEVDENCGDAIINYGGGGGDDDDIKIELNRTRSINRQRLVAHSTAMESIQAEAEPIDEEEDIPPGGIPARNGKGERLIVYVGIIDILQSYRLKKKLEHTFKSMIHDGDTVSVHRPGFYAQRFQTFMEKKVFKKVPSPLKRSPSKRKSLVNRPLRMIGMGQELETDPNGYYHPSCSSAPPPTFAEALDQKKSVVVETNVAGGIVATTSITKHQYRFNYTGSSNKSMISMASSSGASSSRGIVWTPPRSIEGSTPTWTEGTPSFAESSSSGENRCPTSTPQRQIRNSAAMATGLANDEVVEKAINCLTDGMKELKARVENDFVESRSKLNNVVIN